MPPIAGCVKRRVEQPKENNWEQIFYGGLDGRRKKRVLVKIIGEQGPPRLGTRSA